ncbi:MAG: hypothetical protein ACRC78_05985 [Planktothrix sp.]
MITDLRGLRRLTQITHYPLPITHYPLPITHYLLPITHYPLPISENISHPSDRLN